MVGLQAERSHVDAFRTQGGGVEWLEELPAAVVVGQSATHESEPVDAILVAIVAVEGIRRQVVTHNAPLSTLLSLSNSGERIRHREMLHNLICCGVNHVCTRTVGSHTDVSVGAGLNGGDNISHALHVFRHTGRKVIDEEAIRLCAHIALIARLGKTA